MIVESELKVWIFVSLSVICGLSCHLCLHIGSMSEEARLSKSCWEFWIVSDWRKRRLLQHRRHPVGNRSGRIIQE